MASAIDFSIIIPTRDRQPQLEACLEAIAGLDYPRSSFEVIVVDDGSKDPAGPALAPFAGRIDVTVRSQPCGGPASARNTGAAAARGRFLAFLDDDCMPAPDWLGRLSARLNGAAGCVFGGRTANALPGNPYSAASQCLLGYLYGYYNRDPDRARFLASCNLAMPAECFRSVGGFDAAYPRAAAEDRDICDRLHMSGVRLAYAPEAVVFHNHALKPLSFWRQHVNYGRGAFRFWRAHARRCGQGIGVEPPGFYFGLIRAPFTEGGVRRRWFVAALLVVSQIANAAGFLLEWIASRRRGRLDDPVGPIPCA